MTTQVSESVSSSLAIPPLSSDFISPEVLETAARQGVLQHMPAVIDLTRAVFGTFSRVRVLDDPEFVGDVHIIFHVPARGEIEEELNREEEWGRRLMQIIPHSPQVYLVFVDYPP